MSFQLTKLNNEIVRAVPQLVPVDTRPIKGAALFPELYCNAFVCARKKSGKTASIFKMVQKCAGPATKIMVFCSTINKDSSWEVIKLWCEQKGLPFMGYTSLVDDDGTNLLADLIKGLQDEEIAPVNRPNLLDSSDEEEEEKRPPKYQSPEWIFIFDDLGDELKKPVVAAFLKKNRHFKAKVIISTQYINDLLPAARKQLDYVILFGGWPSKKIDEIGRDIDIHISKDRFYEVYQFATEKKYSFLYVDVRGATFRRNFNELITL